MSYPHINCKYYGSMRGCIYGNNCIYNHSNPNSVPLCYYYNNCKYGNNCKFRHINFNFNFIQQSQYYNQNYSNIQYIPNNIPLINNNMSTQQHTNSHSIYYPIISNTIQTNNSQYPYIQTTVDDCKSIKDGCMQYQYSQTTVDDFDCKSIKDGCKPTHRMINALIYYSTLNIDLSCHDSNKIHSMDAISELSN
eukprot:353818_1